MKRKTPTQRMVNVIRDSRNGKLDYELPEDRAKELYAQGKLHWDLTNRCYGTDGSIVR